MPDYQRNLAGALAKVAAIRAEFPDWHLTPSKPLISGSATRGWVARMGNLTVRADTLGELADILRDARDKA